MYNGCIFTYNIDIDADIKTEIEIIFTYGDGCFTQCLVQTNTQQVADIH